MHSFKNACAEIRMCVGSSHNLRQKHKPSQSFALKIFFTLARLKECAMCPAFFASRPRRPTTAVCAPGNRKTALLSAFTMQAGRGEINKGWFAELQASLHHQNTYCKSCVSRKIPFRAFITYAPNSKWATP